MLKKILTLIFALVILLPVSVRADNYPRIDTDWKVTFDGSKLKSNYNSTAIAEALKGMQPGDTADLEFTLVNNYDTEVSWWVGNDVLKSFEDLSKATGGAYVYELNYTDQKGNDSIIYSSKAVGGDNEEYVGLHGATDALKNMFHLGKIGAHKTAVVTLHIELDGETQNNSYQDTLARLQINFAVELPATDEVRFVVPDTATGIGFLDDIISSTGVSLYILMALVCFLLMMVSGAYLYRKGRRG